MKYLIQAFILSVLALFMAGCTPEKVNELLIPKAESELAKDYLAKLKQRDFASIKSALSDEIKDKATDELLENAASFFRSGEPLSVEVIGSQVNVFNGQWQGNFTFEYEFESGWNVANAALRKTADGFEIIGFHVYQTEASQQSINAFKLDGKSFLHYLVLALVVIMPCFILVTLVVCIRTKIHKNKWLWILFILLGIGAIEINWTTGEYAFQLISIHLFGAGAIAAGYAAPWILTASLPIGAVVFWLKRKSFSDQIEPPKSSNRRLVKQQIED